MRAEETRYLSIGQDLGGERSQMFGKPCFKVNGKAFVCFFQNGCKVTKRFKDYSLFRWYNDRGLTKMEMSFLRFTCSHKSKQNGETICVQSNRYRQPERRRWQIAYQRQSHATRRAAASYLGRR